MMLGLTGLLAAFSPTLGRWRLMKIAAARGEPPPMAAPERLLERTGTFVMVAAVVAIVAVEFAVPAAAPYGKLVLFAVAAIVALTQRRKR